MDSRHSIELDSTVSAMSLTALASVIVNLYAAGFDVQEIAANTQQEVNFVVAVIWDAQQVHIPFHKSAHSWEETNLW